MSGYSFRVEIAHRACLHQSWEKSLLCICLAVGGVMYLTHTVVSLGWLRLLRERDRLSQNWKETTTLAPIFETVDAALEVLLPPARFITGT